MYKYYNPNPYGKSVGDCVVRAISKVTKQSWDDTYWGVCWAGFYEGNMPSGNDVWGAYLKSLGFRKYVIPDTCPDCYTVKDFCIDHPIGVFVLATGSHVVAVVNGTYYDSWDSGEEVPIYYWKERTNAIY